MTPDLPNPDSLPPLVFLEIVDALETGDEVLAEAAARRFDRRRQEDPELIRRWLEWLGVRRPRQPSGGAEEAPGTPDNGRGGQPGTPVPAAREHVEVIRRLGAEGAISGGSLTARQLRDVLLDPRALGVLLEGSPADAPELDDPAGPPSAAATPTLPAVASAHAEMLQAAAPPWPRAAGDRPTPGLPQRTTATVTRTPRRKRRRKVVAVPVSLAAALLLVVSVASGAGAYLAWQMHRSTTELIARIDQKVSQDDSRNGPGVGAIYDPDSGHIGRDTRLPAPVPRVDAARFIQVRSGNKPWTEVGPRIVVYDDGAGASDFTPTGWMPNGDGIAQNTREEDRPHSGQHHIRVGCQLSATPWVGMYFLLDGEWEPKRPFNLFEKLGASQGDPIRCRFWARSRDRAWVQFKVGGVSKGQVRDSLAFPAATPWVQLEPEWKMYEIDLTGKDLSSLVGGFAWVCDRQHNHDRDVGFDLDTIYFVKVKEGGEQK